MSQIMKKNSTRATEKIEWGYCEEPYVCLPVDGDVKIAAMMAAETSTTFAGNKISGILVANPVDAKLTDWNTGVYVNSVKEATIWLSNSLDGEPFLTSTGELGPDGFEWSFINFDQPYELKEGENIYFGVSYTVPEGDNGYIADYSYPEYDYTAYLYSKITGIDNNGEFVYGNPSWVKAGTWAGNACIRVSIEGDKLPQNICKVADVSIPVAVKKGTPINVQAGIINGAANEISSVELTLEIEGMEPQTKESKVVIGYDYYNNPVEGAISYNGYGLVGAEFVCDLIGNNLPYKLYVSKINGTDANNWTESYNGYMLSLEEGFAKNNVIEEATGTWCGWCVLGYAGMEYIKENIPTFIGIAMHSGDRMEVMGEGNAYEPFAGYVSGFPSSFLNRNWSSDIYPSPDDFADLYEEIHDIPAVAKISATLKNNDESGKSVKLSTSYEFAISEEKADYGIAYTVVEDDLGPYRQTNYPSGMDGNYYGFENEPDPVSLLFSEVARNCSHPLPFEESILKSTTADNEYTFETDIELSDVSNVNKYRVVAMVINNFNGAIENACVVESPTYVGVESIVSESKSAPIAFGGKGCLTVVATGLDNAIYTADGKCVASGIKSGKVNLAPGLYIVSNGRESVKAVVR